MKLKDMQDHLWSIVEFKANNFGVDFEKDVLDDLRKMTDRGADELVQGVLTQQRIVPVVVASYADRALNDFLDRLIQEALFAAGVTTPLAYHAMGPYGWLPKGLPKAFVTPQILKKIHSQFCPGFWPFC